MIHPQKHIAPQASSACRVATVHHWERFAETGLKLQRSLLVEGLHPSTVNEALWLTLLTPDVVQQVLAGHQPRTLSLKWLQLHPLSSDWTTQRTLFDNFDA